jgi:argininosuccinate lyase
VTLWGGRFAEEPADELWRFTVDESDRRLLGDDVVGSLGHVAMLEVVGIIDEEDADAMRMGLRTIGTEAAEGSFEWKDTDEDVHTAVERRLGELIGDTAGKLHAGRSRNDQVGVDLRLYLKRSGATRIEEIEGMVEVLADKAEAVGDTIVASYTHLQQAQAIPLAHHFLAYAWMLLRDRDRFADMLRRIDVSPLGAGASAGSRLPLDPAVSAAMLGFSDVFHNSMDAVGARDFVSEYAYCCAQTMVTLSRLAEELVIWSTSEFGWVVLSDRFTTGSSAMPHKKNPDAAELARGRSAAVIGDLVALLTLQKGLPLTYNRDLQEDKRGVFHADDTLAGALRVMQAMIPSGDFDPPEPTAMVGALDLAELLVSRGVPFRSAHEAVGRLVMRLAAEGRALDDATAGELEATHVQLVPEDVTSLTAPASVAARQSPGGGSMESVAAQLDAVRRHLGQS